MLIWTAVLVVGARHLIRHHSPLPVWLAYVLLMSGVLALICYWTGEPPRWRWGDRSD
jgi:hypothetical protein